LSCLSRAIVLGRSAGKGRPRELQLPLIVAWPSSDQRRLRHGTNSPRKGENSPHHRARWHDPFDNSGHLGLATAFLHGGPGRLRNVDTPCSAALGRWGPARAGDCLTGAQSLRIKAHNAAKRYREQMRSRFMAYSPVFRRPQNPFRGRYQNESPSKPLWFRC